MNDAGLQIEYSLGVVTPIRPSTKPRHFLREWRKHRGLTQERLAERLDTYKGQISNWETGKRDLGASALSALAEALQIDVPDLFRDPDRPSPDALLRGQPPEVVDQVIEIIHTLTRRRRDSDRAA